MNKYFIILFIFLNTLFISAFSQDYVLGLNNNPIVRNYSEKNLILKNNKALKSSLELPFFDDFSDSNIYPKQTLWQNNYVYVNQTLAIKPPSIGVATFDAVNEIGEIYEHAYFAEPFIADTLTSLPINLNYPSNNTIYLSFYYEAGGIGNSPENGDSLILEFYAPEEDKWFHAWAIDGGITNSNFEFVNIQINDAKYLKNGFKFRFKNIASLGSSIYPDLASNCDFWHIDYVYLNKDRNENDNDFKDIAFTKPLTSLLNNFEAIPWSHFKTLTEQAIKEKLNIEFYNNGNSSRIIDSLNFTLTDLSGNSATQKYYGGTFPFILAHTFSPSEFSNFNFNFPTNNNDTCYFNLQAKIVTNSYDPVQNNVINYTQKFKDYYAYDDGSAEAGYGIYGNGTKFGSVAMKFEPVANGYLQGVNIYFTQAKDGASQNYFWLDVRFEKEDGMPDTAFVSLEGQRPEYTDELNKFYYYEFDEPIKISGNFYVGWTQTNDKMINIGFDYNNIANNNVYYNVAEDWVQSTIKGAIMMRPVFTYETFEKTEKDFSENNNKANVTPSLATDKITIDFNYSPDKQYYLSIYNMQGIQVYSDSNFKNNEINLPNLEQGMYFVKIIEDNMKQINAKFIVR